MYNYRCEYKNSPEYRAWVNMHRSHGSEVCVIWGWYYHDEKANRKNYESFLSFVGRKPEGYVLIRLDKSQPFGPGNVRWGTHSENAMHRGPFRKFSYSRDNELIAELERRGYDTSVLAKDTV